MSTLSAEDYLRNLRLDSQRFLDVLRDCPPQATVPGCPGWDAADLLWHLSEVQWFWTQVLNRRPGPPDLSAARPARPEAYADLLAGFEEHSAALQAELAHADPAEAAWSWGAEQTVGFTFRRQAHEALIHRLDAEQAAGEVTSLDPALAADGVVELLEVICGPREAGAALTPDDQLVRLDCSDTGDRVWARTGRLPDGTPGVEALTAATTDEPGVVVSGSAEALDTWLWRRDEDAPVTVSGDRGVLDHFWEVVGHHLR